MLGGGIVRRVRILYVFYSRRLEVASAAVGLPANSIYSVADSMLLSVRELRSNILRAKNQTEVLRQFAQTKKQTDAFEAAIETVTIEQIYSEFAAFESDTQKVAEGASAGARSKFAASS